MIDLTVKTLDSRNHAFSVPDDVSIDFPDNISMKVVKVFMSLWFYFTDNSWAA